MDKYAFAIFSVLSPAPAICTPLPEDMTFTVTPTSDTAVPIEPAAIQTGAPILFARGNDLWRADLYGQNEQRLTEGEILADGSSEAEILLPDAFLLDVIAAWQ